MTDDKADNGEPSSKRKRAASKVRTRPNFFVAVQVSNPQIHREVNMLQKLITSKKPLYKSVLINLITLHITLCTLHLAGNKDIRRAKTALKKLEFDMKETFERDPLSLKFKGIGSFKNEVVFAKIEPGEPLTRMTNLHGKLVEALKEEGLLVTDKFDPHLTLMKMSKDWTLRKKKVFKIPRELYKENDGMEFGDQHVRGVQLLSMGYRAEKSYYSCYHHLDLGSYHIEEEEHEECCGVKSVFPSSVVEMNPESTDEEDVVTEEVFAEAVEKSTAENKKRTKKRKLYKKTLWKKDVKLQSQVQKMEEKSICDIDKNFKTSKSEFFDEFKVFEPLFVDNEQQELQVEDGNLNRKFQDFKNKNVSMEVSSQEKSLELKNVKCEVFDEVRVSETGLEDNVRNLLPKNGSLITETSTIIQVEKTNPEVGSISAENSDSELRLCEEFKVIDPNFGSQNIRKSMSQEDESFQDLKINVETSSQQENMEIQISESEKGNRAIEMSVVQEVYVNTEEEDAKNKNILVSEELGKEIYYCDSHEIEENETEIQEINVKTKNNEENAQRS